MGLFAGLFESIIRFPARDDFPDFLEPAGPHFQLSIEFRNIRLDVEERCAVENVHILDVKYTVLHLVKLHHRKSDRVRALGSRVVKSPRTSESMKGSTCRLNPWLR